MGTGLVSVVGCRLTCGLVAVRALRDVGVTVQRQRFVDICWMFKESKKESSNCNSKSSGNKKQATTTTAAKTITITTTANNLILC